MRLDQHLGNPFLDESGSSSTQNAEESKTIVQTEKKLQQCHLDGWFHHHGTLALYYGRPDIMVFPSGSVCGIAVPKSRDQFYKAKHLAHEDEKQIVEVKDNYTALKNRKNVSLITAQALTFAYYQKMFQHQYRNEPIHLPHVSLIPTVAICKNYFDIYMYDFENDIFLKNRDGPIPLWNEDDPDERTATLNCSSVFILWMTVNHLTFRPRFSKSAVDLMGRSCGFQRQLSEDRLQEIESTIAVGKHFKIPSSEKVIDKAPIKLIIEEDP